MKQNTVGKVLQQRQSLTINGNDKPTSISTQMDCLIPAIFVVAMPICTNVWKKYKIHTSFYEDFVPLQVFNDIGCLFLYYAAAEMAIAQ